MTKIGLALDGFKLPRIIVAGNESSGKSTILNRLAFGSYFPQSPDWCTKMPIVLRMIHTPGGASRCIVRVPNVRGGLGREEVITQPDRAARILAIMTALVAQMPPHQALLEQELQIEVRSPDVPTLELVDLPGIVEAPDLRTPTRELTKRYMTQPNTLVLCMVTANTTRLRTSQAMGLVQELKVEKNSIAILTMW